MIRVGPALAILPPGAIALLGSLWCATAGAAAETRHTIAVHLHAEVGAEPWFARAVEHHIIDIALDHRSLQATPGVDLRLCPHPFKSACVAPLYAQASRPVAVLVLGQIHADTLTFSWFHPGRRHTAVSSTSVFLGPGAHPARLRSATQRALRPFVRPGGLLQRPVTATSPGVASFTASDILRRGDVQMLLALIILLFMLPIARLRSLLSRQQFANLGWRRAWNAPSAVIVTLGLLLASPSALAHQSMAWTATAWPALHLWPGTQALVGGVLWGSLLLIVLRAAVPGIWGIERVRHSNLGALLEAWTAAVLGRTLLLALLYLPFAALTWYGMPSLGLSRHTILIIALPSTGLLTHLWLLAWVDSLAIFVDCQAIAGTQNSGNPWHAHIKKYFLGYVKRLGLDIDEHLLRRIVFLPSTGDTIHAYGRSADRVRILVPTTVLELALHLPEEVDEVLRAAVDQQDWGKGLLLPVQAGVKSNKSRRRLLRRKKERRPRADPPADSTAATRGTARPRLLGRHLTSLGAVMPLRNADSLPLVANDEEDLSVVRELLTEHYSAYEQREDLFGAEFDDTDPTQKDFLFGKLLWEIGAARRGDTLFETFALSMAARDSSLTTVVRFLVAPLRRYGVFLGDSFAALNHGRDHLIQYLALLDSTRGTTAEELWPAEESANPSLESSASALPQGIDADLNHNDISVVDSTGNMGADPTDMELKPEDVGVVDATGDDKVDDAEQTDKDSTALAGEDPDVVAAEENAAANDTQTADEGGDQPGQGIMAPAGPTSTGGPAWLGCSDVLNLLTARADEPLLQQTSYQLVRQAIAEHGGHHWTATASPAIRLLWLSRYLEPTLLRQASRMRRAVVGVVFVGLGLGLGLAIKEALDYHPVYQQRINSSAAAPESNSAGDPAHGKTQ